MMRGAIRYKRKEVLLFAIIIGIYVIAFIFIASEYVSTPMVSDLMR